MTTSSILYPFIPMRLRSVAEELWYFVHHFIAKKFVEKLSIDASLVLVDSIDDSLEQGYEARPERLYVVQQGKVLWRCGLGPFEYDPDGLESFVAGLK